MKTAVIGILVLGFALLALSAGWNTIFPATSSWTAEKEKHLSELKSQVHNLSFKISDPSQQVKRQGEKDPADVKAEYERLKAEAEGLMAEFQSAYDRPQFVSTALKWTGLTFAAIGIVGWFATKGS